jgi:hypothetical protein
MDQTVNILSAADLDDDEMKFRTAPPLTVLTGSEF